MAKKIRLKKHINEAAYSSTTTADQYDVDKNNINPYELLKELENIEKIEKAAAEHLNSVKKGGLKNEKRVNISKMGKCKVRRFDGTVEEIDIKRTVHYVRAAKNALLDNPEIKPIMGAIQKDIIWTFAIPTAATDGIRLAMNPVFADQLLSKDVALWKNDQKVNPNSKFGSFSGRCIQFTLMHEAYHVIYRHLRRELAKKETADGALHHLANIAQDVEINRDIEYQYPELFAGVTELIGGMFDNSFQNGEMWEQIFDAYYSGQKTPPQMGQSMNQNGGQPQQSGQSGQSGQQKQQSNQSGQSGQQGQSGSQSGKNKNNQNGGGNGKPDLDKKSPDYLKGYADALKDYKEGKIDLNNLSFISESLATDGILDQAEYDKGYQDALEKIKAIKEQAQQNANQQNGANDQDDMNNSGSGQNSDSNSEQNGNNNQSNGNNQDDEEVDYDERQAAIEDMLANGEWEVSENTEGDGFHYGDVLTPEQMQKIAEEAGQPYDAEDLSKDPVKEADDYVRNNQEALNNCGQGGSPAGHSRGLGKGNTIAQVNRAVNDMFKPKVNWKRKLQTFFNGLTKTTDEVTFSRKRLSSSDPDMDAGRYTKPRVKTNWKKDGIAQVFHLIDNSGSMYSQTRDGQRIFTQIFSEILTMEKKAHIQLSSSVFFCGSTNIPDSAFSLWDEKTPKSTVLNILSTKQKDDAMGGTLFNPALQAAMKKGKPYFSKRIPITLTLIYTDGELMNNDYEFIKGLQMGIKRKIVFVVINNSEKYRNQALENLKQSGIRESNIVLIDANEI